MYFNNDIMIREDENVQCNAWLVVKCIITHTYIVYVYGGGLKCKVVYVCVFNAWVCIGIRYSIYHALLITKIYFKHF